MNVKFQFPVNFISKINCNLYHHNHLMANKRNTNRRISRPKVRKPACKKRKAEDVELVVPLEPVSITEPSSCSASKILLPSLIPEVDSDDLGNGIVNMNLLVSLIKQFPCLACGGETHVLLKNLGGLAQRLVINCGACKNVVKQDLSNPLLGESTNY